MSSPTKEPVERWFCIRVFTRSIGYTAVAPVATHRQQISDYSPVITGEFTTTAAAGGTETTGESLTA